jgi:hypothetical protein
MERRSEVDKVTFDTDNAWILWAIPTNKEGTDLRGLISAADALNHAIPDRDLIERSIIRGIQAGLVELSGDRFRFVTNRRKRITETENVSKTWFKQLDALYEYLASKEWPVTGESGYHLSKEKYDKVVKDYMGSF